MKFDPGKTYTYFQMAIVIYSAFETGIYQGTEIEKTETMSAIVQYAEVNENSYSTEVSEILEEHEIVAEFRSEGIAEENTEIENSVNAQEDMAEQFDILTDAMDVVDIQKEEEKRRRDQQIEIDSNSRAPYF